MKVDHTKIAHHAMTRREFEAMLDRLFGIQQWNSSVYDDDNLDGKPPTRLHLYYANASDPLDAHVGTWKNRNHKGSWTWACDEYKKTEPNQPKGKYTMDTTDHKQLNAFRTDFNVAMKALEEKYNVTVKMGNMSYDNDRFTSKLTVLKRSESGEVRHPSEADFDKFCRSFGLKPEHKGAIIRCRGGDYKLIGLNPRSPKFRFTVQSVTDPSKYLKVTEEGVKKQLGIPVDLV